jgi:hypothetical protein
MSTDLDNFTGLSVVLTGIDQERLAPSVDPIGLPAQYASLLAEQQTPQQIGTAILMQNGQPATTQTALAARAIMKLWLLGVWYQPYAQGAFPLGEQTVVSDEAYTQSWAWSIAQAHPMGYSEFFFGYWNSPPPSLEDFTGVAASLQPGASS